MGKGKKKSHQKQHLRQKCPNLRGQIKWIFRGKEEARGIREASTAFLKKAKKAKYPPQAATALLSSWTVLQKRVYLFATLQSPFPTHYRQVIADKWPGQVIAVWWPVENRGGLKRPQLCSLVSKGRKSEWQLAFSVENTSLSYLHRFYFTSVTSVYIIMVLIPHYAGTSL